MPYSTPWDEAAPPGSSTQANTLDTVIQNLKRDLRERMNELVKDWTTDPITRLSRFRANLNVPQTITSGGLQTIVYNTELFDVGGGYDPATGIYTVPATGDKGTWLFIASAEFLASGAGLRRIYIDSMDGGVTTEVDARVVPSASFDVTVGVSTLINGLVAGNRIRVQVEQTSGGNLDVAGVQQTTYFQGIQLP